MKQTLKGNMVIAQSGGPSMVINQSLVGAVLAAKKKTQIKKIWTDCSRSPSRAQSSSSVLMPQTGTPSTSWITSSGFVKRIPR